MVGIGPSADEATDQLREQATCCRRLARSSRTDIASRALLEVARHFETDAFRIERESQDRRGEYDNSATRLRAALASQEAMWLRVRPSTNGDRNG
jgi:hypothetical protein